MDKLGGIWELATGGNIEAWDGFVSCAIGGGEKEGRKTEFERFLDSGRGCELFESILCYRVAKRFGNGSGDYCDYTRDYFCERS